MRHMVDPGEQRLFSPFDGLFSGQAIRHLQDGWQGVLRHVLLKVMPARELGTNFHPTLGAPTKELYSMAGLVFLADFKHWTVEEAIEAYLFHSDVQYALNLEPGGKLCTRSLERYQKLFRNSDLGETVMRNVTDELAKVLDLNVTRQRLDSTHIFSRMATFGRTRLLATTTKRFLMRIRKGAAAEYALLPQDLRKRYEVTVAQLFASKRKKDPDAAAKGRQQAAEDLLFVIEHFADKAFRPGYRTLLRVFAEQCELVEGQGKVAIKQKTGGDCLQNPSDLDATFDGHKGPGYQVQLSETCSEDNEVQLILGALPQTACERDEQALVPMLEQLQGAGHLPKEVTADTQYGSDANYVAAAALGVELIAPVAGRPVQASADTLTVDDFAVDERTGMVDACPAGHAPLSVQRDAAAGLTVLEMSAATCQACPHQEQCPIHKGRDDRFTLEYTDKELRTASRRCEQETEVFQERYSSRAGIESTNSGAKNRLDMGTLRVRGRGSVFRVLWHKVAGWNLLRAAASAKLRAVVADAVARSLGLGRSAQDGEVSRHDFGRPAAFPTVSRRLGTSAPASIDFLAA